MIKYIICSIRIYKISLVHYNTSYTELDCQHQDEQLTPDHHHFWGHDYYNCVKCGVMTIIIV